MVGGRDLFFSLEIFLLGKNFSFTFFLGVNFSFLGAGMSLRGAFLAGPGLISSPVGQKWPQSGHFWPNWPGDIREKFSDFPEYRIFPWYLENPSWFSKSAWIFQENPGTGYLRKISDFSGPENSRLHLEFSGHSGNSRSWKSGDRISEKKSRIFQDLDFPGYTWKVQVIPGFSRGWRYLRNISFFNIFLFPFFYP